MGFAPISRPAVRAIVTCVVELDRSNDPCLRTKDKEVERQLTDAIQDTRIAQAALEPQSLQKLHLGEHDVARQRLHEPSVQNLFRIAEERVLRLQRPGFVKTLVFRASCLAKQSRDNSDCGGAKQDPEQLHGESPGKTQSPLIVPSNRVARSPQALRSCVSNRTVQSARHSALKDAT